MEHYFWRAGVYEVLILGGWGWVALHYFGWVGVGESNVKGGGWR